MTADQVASESGYRQDAATFEVPVRATVSIPTFHRPQQVGQTLRAVLDQTREINADPDSRFQVDVLVVDNDPEGSARTVVQEDIASPLVRYVIEPRPGISAARNRMLDECAGSDVVIFIDDDETPHPSWLIALLERYQVDRPAGVYGRVVVEFDGPLNPWIAAGGFFARFDAPDGAELAAAAAGNLLLDLGQLRRHGLRFDERLGLSGGEDSLLTRALVRRGGRIVRCARSVVSHEVSAERMTRRWVLQRSWSHGNTHALIPVMLAPDPIRQALARGRAFAGGLVRAVVGLGRSVLGLLMRSEAHQARGLRTAFRGAGMASGAVGYTFQEYARRSKKGWF